MTRKLSKRLFVASVVLVVIAPLVSGLIALLNDQPVTEWLMGSVLPAVVVAIVTALVAWYVHANADEASRSD